MQITYFSGVTRAMDGRGTLSKKKYSLKGLPPILKIGKITACKNHKHMSKFKAVVAICCYGGNTDPQPLNRKKTEYRLQAIPSLY